MADYESAYNVNEKSYDECRNTLAGVEYPHPRDVDTQALKPHFDWQRGRFNSLQKYIDAGFKYLAHYDQGFVRICKDRNDSMSIRQAELQNVLQQLQRCEQRLTQLVNSEEEKDIGAVYSHEDQDQIQLALDQKKRRAALRQTITESKDERINHVNLKITVLQMKSAQKEAGSKKHVEQVHDSVFKAVIQSVFNRKFTDKSEVKKNFKDDRYIRHVMLRRNGSTLTPDIVTDMEEAVKGASQLDKIPEFIENFATYLSLMVKEANAAKELRSLQRQINRNRAQSKAKPDESPKYNPTDVHTLKTKIHEAQNYISQIIQDLQYQRQNSDLQIQRDQQVVEALKIDYAEVEYEHNDAQQIKRAPKERSLSKIPIQNQRSSLVTEEEAQEASMTADIHMEGPQKSKKSGGFFACCGFS